MHHFLLIFLLIIAVPSFSVAKDKGPEFEETPITKWIDAENALLDTLPKENQRAFFVMRNKHSVVRSVKIVMRDVGNAVTECGKKNKDYKDTIYQRYYDWKGALDPILKEAQKFMKQELKEQKAFHVSDYNHVMNLNDKAYKFSEKQVMKKPVSTMEACKNLHKSMDRTEDQLVDLLQDILLPEEVVRKRAERAAGS